MTNTNTTAIVAHDAGAANHIIAWLESGLIKENQCVFCLSGPAEVSYRKIRPQFLNQNLKEVLDGANQLISGTGWASTMEHDARKLANQQNMKTIAVLDHWVNYRDRFIRNGQEQLADEIWVVDEYALDIAQKQFPSIPVHCQHNDFIAQQQQMVASYQTRKSSSTHLLFVMEPVRKFWGKRNIPGEVQALEFMLKHQDHLNFNNSITSKPFKIIIKPHPSDPKDKYKRWLNKYNHFDISINESASLAKLIAWSDIVAGCETYAMVVALASGKKVVSALPTHAPPCNLPHKDIIRLAERVGAVT